jgi:DNA polymerase III epsilon subunit-like protein
MENWRRYLLKEAYILDEDFFDVSIEILFQKLGTFGNHSWIFFDTETTNLKPTEGQLTEIAAVVAYPNNWQFDEVEAERGVFYDKIRLTPETTERFEAQTEEDPKFALKLTRYGMPKGEYEEKYPKGMPEEIDVIKEFYSFIESQENPVLVAQNAEFDINFVQTRGDFYELRKDITQYPIFDTQMLLKLWHNPLIKTLAEQGDERATRILQALTMEGKFGKYTSASMGVVSKAYEIDTDEWHNALADVKMMMSMTREIFMTLQQSSETDVTQQQQRAAYGVRKRRARES